MQYEITINVFFFFFRRAARKAANVCLVMSLIVSLRSSVTSSSVISEQDRFAIRIDKRKARKVERMNRMIERNNE